MHVIVYIQIFSWKIYSLKYSLKQSKAEVSDIDIEVLECSDICVIVNVTDSNFYRYTNSHNYYMFTDLTIYIVLCSHLVRQGKGKSYFKFITHILSVFVTDKVEKIKSC